MFHPNQAPSNEESKEMVQNGGILTLSGRENHSPLRCPCHFVAMAPWAAIFIVRPSDAAMFLILR